MTTEKKTVSIVIPARNEEQYISRCLDSVILANDPSFELEVFVNDGCSSDRTREIVSQYSAKYPWIVLLENRLRITSGGLNTGIRASRGEIVIILGAHSGIYPDFIKNCILYLDRYPEAGCVGGIIENQYEDDRSESIGMAMSSAFGVGNAHFRTGTKEGFVDTVAFGAYRKEVFGEAGLFDETLVRNQDDEFNFRLLKMGYKIFLSHQIRSRYFVRTGFKKLFSQYFQYGYWKVIVNLKHKTITTLRQIIPVLFVIFILISIAGILINRYIFYGGSFVFLIYLITGFYFTGKFTKAIRKRLLILRAFITLHVSYGSGYLAGIVRSVFHLKP